MVCNDCADYANVRTGPGTKYRKAYTLKNGTYVDTVTVSQAQNGDGFSIVIDDELINEGDNTITFTSDLWSSSAVNPADGRMLGYAIENVTFEG